MIKPLLAVTDLGTRMGVVQGVLADRILDLAVTESGRLRLGAELQGRRWAEECGIGVPDVRTTLRRARNSIQDSGRLVRGGVPLRELREDTTFARARLAGARRVASDLGQAVGSISSGSRPSSTATWSTTTSRTRSARSSRSWARISNGRR